MVFLREISALLISIWFRTARDTLTRGSYDDKVSTSSTEAAALIRGCGEPHALLLSRLPIASGSLA